MRWGGNEEVPGLIPAKRKGKEKKPIKEISVFKLPTIGGLNRHQSTRSKIVHPKLGMLTLYTIPEHIKVVAT